MPTFLSSLWSDESLLLIIGFISLLLFLLTLILIPWLILRIPEDYFSAQKRNPLLGRMRHPVIGITILALKNLFGVVFLVLGILLLVLPGQGLLTMLLGIIMIDFPGKYRLERWFVSQGSILRTVNWLRKKGKRAPIKL
jgi:hypothetical protein